MAVTPRELAAFRAYLEEFGLSESTLDTYLAVTARAFACGGWIARLKSDLAPKSKRLVRAAARHWADWQEDGKLRESLKRLRLPAPRRMAAKVPLTREQHRRLVAAVAKDREIDPATRATIELMAFRGFRCGDVLRMKKLEIQSALAQNVLAYEAKGRRRLEFAVLGTFRPWLELLAQQPGRWVRVEDLIAPTAEDGPARRRAAARKVQRELERVGREVGIAGVYPHQLRRTFAVEYLKANKGDPEAIIKLVSIMQWAGIATAMEYINHARGAELDAVAETMFDP